MQRALKSKKLETSQADEIRNFMIAAKEMES